MFQDACMPEHTNHVPTYACGWAPVCMGPLGVISCGLVSLPLDLVQVTPSLLLDVLSLFLAFLPSTSSFPRFAWQPGVRATFLKRRADPVTPTHGGTNRVTDRLVCVCMCVPTTLCERVCTYPLCFCIYFTVCLGNAWAW